MGISLVSVARAWHELDVARFKAELYRMWGMGHRAGLAHPTALRTSGDFRRSPTVARLRDALLQGTARRETLAEITAAHPNLFVSFEASLLRLGEETGQLDAAFRMLGDYFTAEHRMILKVKKWLAYPMMNAVAAIFIWSFPILFYGNTTGYLLTVGAQLALAFAFGGGLLLAAARRYQNKPRHVLARLARALALGVEAGLPLGRVVELAVSAAASPELTAAVARVSRIETGRQTLADTFRGSQLVPFEVIAALEVADASGNYRDTLGKLADRYDDPERVLRGKRV